MRTGQSVLTLIEQRLAEKSWIVRHRIVLTPRTIYEKENY
jgi:hypothetical protein